MKYKIFFLITFLNFITCRKKFDIMDITKLMPKFEKIETEPTYNSTYIKFQFLENYNHEYKYELSISEYNKENWIKNLKFFQNWKYNDDDFISFYENEGLWLPWNLYPSTTERIMKIENLNSSKISFYK
jgi:hypothetical protein